MSNDVVNMHAAKTQLSQLVKRAERGERITIARNGKPVAQIGPAPRARRTALPPTILYSTWRYSFTDCTSFVVMNELELSQALTTDKLFPEAGFEALLVIR